jgi:hypothetical protein
MNRPNLMTVLEQLHAEGGLAGDPVIVAEGLRTGDRGPWFVAALQSLAGWLAAIFLIGFALEVVRLRSDTGLLSAGGLACAAAAVAAWSGAARSAFVEQLILALSLAGAALASVGLVGLAGGPNHPAAALAVLTFVLLLVLANPTFVHRLLMSLAAVAVLHWLVYLLHIPYAVQGLVVLFGTAAATLWLHESHWTCPRWNALVRPLAYALALALPGMLWLSALQQALDPNLVRLVTGRAAFAPWWLAGLGLAGVLGYVAWEVMGEWAGTEAAAVRLRIAVAVALGAAVVHRAPGVLAGLLLLVLGFQRGNRLLQGLGVLALLAYLAAYYYSLELTLLAKSAVLAASGTLMLGARLFLHRLGKEN